MNVRILIWYAALVATAIYAARRGGQPERAVAAMIVAASLATTVVPIVPDLSFRTVVWPLLLIDMALLAGLTATALTADRYWPLWFAATQLLAVAVHGVRAYDESILPVVYARLGGELGYPTLVILAVGTWRHVRRGREPDWSWQVVR